MAKIIVKLFFENSERFVSTLAILCSWNRLLLKILALYGRPPALMMVHMYNIFISLIRYLKSIKKYLALLEERIITVEKIIMRERVSFLTL